MVLAIPLFAEGQKKNGVFNKEHMNVSLHGRYTHMLDGHNMYKNMLDSYGAGMAGIQVGFDTHPSDSSWWANAYNYPHLAFGFSYDATGSLKTKPGAHMGDFYNLYLAMEFDFFRAGPFSVGPVIEVGATFSTERYDLVYNRPNAFIGSTLVANLAGGLELKYRFLPQWELALTGYLIHHSNGMTRVPNWGTNQAAVGAKVKYYLAQQETARKISLEKPLFPKGLHWNVYAAAGVHSCSIEQKALQKLGERGYPVKPRLRTLVGVEAEGDTIICCQLVWELREITLVIPIKLMILLWKERLIRGDIHRYIRLYILPRICITAMFLCILPGVSIHSGVPV